MGESAAHVDLVSLDKQPGGCCSDEVVRARFRVVNLKGIEKN